MRKISAIVLISLFLSGCASSPIDKPITYNDFKGTGLVVGSITFTDDKPSYNAYSFYMNSLSDDKEFAKANSHIIRISPEQTFKVKFKGELNDGKTYLFAFDRAPGKYAMNNFILFTNGGYAVVHTGNKFRFEIPYEVKKGEITYIGEFLFTKRDGSMVGKIKVSDNFERDIIGLRAKAPMINWTKAQNNTVKSGNSGNGTVEF